MTTADRTVNIPLLRKAVEWAEAEAAKPPELCEWRQAWWVTPSLASESAAWGMWASGGQATDIGRSPECGTCYCIAGYVVATQVGPVGDGDALPEEAADLLGLDEIESTMLFRASNSIEDVRRIAESLAGERL